MKRFISMVLVIVMMFTLIPINSNDAYAVDDIEEHLSKTPLN